MSSDSQFPYSGQEIYSSHDFVHLYKINSISSISFNVVMGKDSTDPQIMVFN